MFERGRYTSGFDEIFNPEANTQNTLPTKATNNVMVVLLLLLETMVALMNVLLAKNPKSMGTLLLFLYTHAKKYHGPQRPQKLKNSLFCRGDAGVGVSLFGGLWLLVDGNE